MNIRDPNLPFNLTSFRALQDELARQDSIIAAHMQQLEKPQAAKPAGPCAFCVADDMGHVCTGACNA